jgi:hypothetical protein
MNPAMGLSRWHRTALVFIQSMNRKWKFSTFSRYCGLSLPRIEIRELILANDVDVTNVVGRVR